jgi:hypothetical protein
VKVAVYFAPVGAKANWFVNVLYNRDGGCRPFGYVSEVVDAHRHIIDLVSARRSGCPDFGCPRVPDHRRQGRVMADKWLCCETFNATFGGNKFYRVTNSRGVERPKGF